MTTFAKRPTDDTLWAAMPGWGIVADLTPPELIEARRLQVVKKIVAIALLAVVLICAGGFVYATMKRSDASDALTAARQHNVQLQQARGQYATVTDLQASTQAIETQLASLGANAVDVAALVTRMRDALPGTMSLTSLSVSLSTATTGTDTATSLDRSGNATIGTVTLSGSAQTFVDVAGYVTALSGLTGVANVIPTNNSVGSASATQWNITLQLTSALYPTTSTSPSTTTTTTGGR